MTTKENKLKEGEKIIDIFEINNDAYKFYKQNTKRGKECTYEIVKRRFTAFILNACKAKDMGLGSIIYKFGDFNIVVNYEDFNIQWVYWSNERLYISPKQSQNLKDTYTILGLSEDGRSLIGDVKYEELNALAKKSGFSNKQKYVV